MSKKIMCRSVCGVVLALFLLSNCGYAVNIVLFSDDFNHDVLNTTDLNAGLDGSGGRTVSGIYSTTTYVVSAGPVWRSQISNANRPGAMLLYGVAAGPDYNFNDADSNGGVEISVDLRPTNGTDPTTANWCGIVVGSNSPAMNAPTPEGGLGILFKANGTIQAWDGSTRFINDDVRWITGAWDGKAPIQVRILATGLNDGNPFDGIDRTQIDVYVNDTLVVTRVSENANGYANNYVSFSGSNHNNMFDNLSIEQVQSPDIVSNRYPGGGKKLIPVNVVCSWDAPANYTPEGYNVYVGTEPNTATAEYSSLGQTGTTFDPGGSTVDLAYETDYYWQVDALEPNGVGNPPIVHASAIWKFTTRPQIPTVSASPVSVVVEAGGSAVFEVQGLDVDTYTWKRVSDGATLLTGPTATTLTLANCQITPDEDYYYCELSNGGGTVSTEAAGLWIKRLISHWAFEDNLVDSESGKTGVYSDVSGPLTGTPIYADGINGKCLDLRADPNFVEIPDGDFYNFYAAAYTVSLWIQSDDLKANSSLLSKIDTADTDAGFTIYATGGSALASLQEVSGWSQVQGATDVSDNAWHHVVVTYDPADRTQKLYIDGLLEDTSSAQPAAENVPIIYPNSANLHIGVRSEQGGSHYPGLIDDLKIWNYPLDAVTIAHIYTDPGFAGGTVCLGLPDWDLTGPGGEPDCKVDINDFAAMAATWLECNIVPDCL